LSSRRARNALGLLACLGLLGYAWYAQAHLGLEPCPLCIFQRIGVAACGALFLLAALQNPKPVGARIYGVLLTLCALALAGVAARHIWIQHQPPGTVQACGASLNYMLEVFPLTDVIRKVLTGSGECAVVSWSFLGLSMPAWVLLAALGLGGFAAWVNFPARSGQEIAQRG
jgi:disulfide bond formation protein DsbB